MSYYFVLCIKLSKGRKKAKAFLLSFLLFVLHHYIAMLPEFLLVNHSILQLFQKSTSLLTVAMDTVLITGKDHSQCVKHVMKIVFKTIDIFCGCVINRIMYSDPIVTAK